MPRPAHHPKPPRRGFVEKRIRNIVFQAMADYTEAEARRVLRKMEAQQRARIREIQRSLEVMETGTASRERLEEELSVLLLGGSGAPGKVYVGRQDGSISIGPLDSKRGSNTLAEEPSPQNKKRDSAYL